MDRYFTCYKNILHLFSNSYCQDNNFSPNLRIEGVLFNLKFYRFTEVHEMWFKLN
jgi:hypothetical protein